MLGIRLHDVSTVLEDEGGVSLPFRVLLTFVAGCFDLVQL